MAYTVLPRFRAREKRPSTLIYVIGVAGDVAPVKIGVTCEGSNRLGGLQVGSPVKLVLHHMQEIGPLASRFETAVHRALWNRRAHGEWFAVVPSEAVALVKKMATRVSLFASLRSVKSVEVRLAEATPSDGRTTWEIERKQTRGKQRMKLMMERVAEKDRALMMERHVLAELEFGDEWA